jgi:hypothetical protein
LPNPLSSLCSALSPHAGTSSAHLARRTADSIRPPIMDRALAQFADGHMAGECGPVYHAGRRQHPPVGVRLTVVAPALLCSTNHLIRIDGETESVAPELRGSGGGRCG